MAFHSAASDPRSSEWCPLVTVYLYIYGLSPMCSGEPVFGAWMLPRISRRARIQLYVLACVIVYYCIVQ